MKRAWKCGLLAASFLSVAPGPRPPTPAARQSPPPTPSRRDAGALYAKHCATCHGKDGRAKTFKARFNGARDLTDAAWQTEATDERLFNSVTNGRGKMPPFKKKLSPAEVESLVAFVRTLRRAPRRAVGDRRAPD